ncbi:MAG: COX15/CtaA family protein [Alphaproteobacteria bacterium]|nr:COX15/CtaA family protein [Alphaproteobacteria bacterium]
MVMVGGATRLTESGLSIVDWRPVTGALPPMDQQDWMVEFDKYRTSPQYQQVNKGMSLDEFKEIYWWEWGHRLLGRLIGFAFALPFVAFLLLGRVERALIPKLAVLFFLGGMQGALGWFMVASGLVDRPAVSHYRLAAHLSLAILIYLALLWTAWGLFDPRDEAPGDPAHRRAGQWIWAALAAAGIQVVLGAFVAGLRAGLTYNTWPLMDGDLIPGHLFMQSPWWLNFFENITMVQFQHRSFAWVVVILALVAAWRAAALGLRRPAAMVALAVVAQFMLGIITLIEVVPVSLGVAHQGGAVVVLTTLLWLLHRVRSH